jgi:hypothetical protein
MRSLLRYWLCFAALLSLAIYSFAAGSLMELAATGITFWIKRFLGNAALPALSDAFFALHTDYTHTLLTIAFYPTLFTSFYFVMLMARRMDITERLVRFGMAAMICFTIITSYLVAGIFSMAAPLLPGCNCSISGGPPPAPPLQMWIWIGFLALLALNVLILITVLLRRRTTARGRELQIANRKL